MAPATLHLPLSTPRGRRRGFRSARGAAAALALGMASLWSCSSFEDLQDLSKDAPSAARCGQCHGAIYEEWRGSAHARAFVSGEFQARSDGGRLAACVSCHAPEALAGRTTRPLSARQDHREDGVACAACHRVPADHGDSPRSAAMAGPLGRTALVQPHSITAQEEWFHDAGFCGRCHEDTYREWQSAAPAAPPACQACHMPAAVRKVTQATGPLSALLVALEEKHRLRAHRFSSAAALAESVQVLAGDFLELRAAPSHRGPSLGGARLELVNHLPHRLPTGAFGRRRLELLVRVDGRPAAARTLSTKPGRALGPGASQELELPLGPGAHQVELELRRPPAPGDGAELLIWRRELRLVGPRQEPDARLAGKGP